MTQEDREDFARLYDDSPDTIGNWGEIITASTLRDQCNLRVLRTLYMGHSQIDMVAISPYGVFVIENKNYHGVVTGSVSDKFWRVQYRPGGRVYQLYNPIWQNQKHADDVRNVLGLLGHASVAIYNPVIFNDLTDLRVTGYVRRGRAYKLADFVETYNGVDIAPPLGDDYCKSLEDLFRRFQDCSDEAKEAHVASIQARSKSSS